MAQIVVSDTKRPERGNSTTAPSLASNGTLTEEEELGEEATGGQG